MEALKNEWAALLRGNPLLEAMRQGREVFWFNPEKKPWADCRADMPWDEDVKDAAARLKRFAPVIRHYFPETAAAGGIIESPLRAVPAMQREMNLSGGRLFIKLDSDLPVSGSVKARGGIYEVLQHTEELALTAGILRSTGDDYLALTTPEARDFFARHKIQVGSTGNLGLSIGIMSAALGYEAIIHMSSDARQWKKDLLRARGAEVVEYEGDYGQAVLNGRRRSEADPLSYFVDDENSKTLFFGYAVAGERLQKQLAELDVPVDAAHPLFVYIPCGVGGAPGGISYGLKRCFGDAVHCFFAEPTQSLCMTLGLASGLLDRIAVQDIGLSGRTEADGLAVGRASAFVSAAARQFLSGCCTVEDRRLVPWLKALHRTEGIFIEPSACAAFQGPAGLWETEEGQQYLRALAVPPENITHLIWATGGSMVPEEERAQLLG